MGRETQKRLGAESDLLMVDHEGRGEEGKERQVSI